MILKIVPGKEPYWNFYQKKGNFKLLVSYVSCDCKKDWNKLFAESFLLVQILWDLVPVDLWKVVGPTHMCQDDTHKSIRELHLSFHFID